MDIQHFLAMNIMVISALVLLGALMQRAARLDPWWVGVNALVLVTGAAMLQWAPGSAGTVVALIFVPFVMGPLIIDRMLQRRVAQRRMVDAARLARVATWLYPTATTRFNAAMLEAQSGATAAEQRAGLERLAARSSGEERVIVEVARLRLGAHWEQVLDRLEAQPAVAQAMPALFIRALGETGHVDRMARAYENAKAYLHGNALWEAQLVLLAHAGRREAVQRLLDGPLAGFDDEMKSYWTAIAGRAAGMEAQAWRPALGQIAETSASPPTRAAALRALSGTGPGAVALDDVAAVIVEEVEARLRRAAAPASETQARWTPVTWLLLAAIAGGYLLAEWRGGASSLRTLVDLGGLWPPYVTRRGEWWRLASALFLHFGLLHAAVNGLMLWVLGRACERGFGSWRMAVVYIAGGLGSSGFVLWLMVSGNSEQAVLVGASGAIMALFGALAGRSLVVWLRYRDTLDGRNLMSLALIAGLQVAVDLMTPQVSLAAHASGFVIGCVVGALLTLRPPGRRVAER